METLATMKKSYFIFHSTMRSVVVVSLIRSIVFAGMAQASQDGTPPDHEVRTYTGEQLHSLPLINIMYPYEGPLGLLQLYPKELQVVDIPEELLTAKEVGILEEISQQHGRLGRSLFASGVADIVSNARELTIMYGALSALQRSIVELPKHSDQGEKVEDLNLRLNTLHLAAIHLQDAAEMVIRSQGHPDALISAAGFRRQSPDEIRTVAELLSATNAFVGALALQRNRQQVVQKYRSSDARAFDGAYAIKAAFERTKGGIFLPLTAVQWMDKHQAWDAWLGGMIGLTKSNGQSFSRIRMQQLQQHPLQRHKERAAHAQHAADWSVGKYDRL